RVPDPLFWVRPFLPLAARPAVRASKKGQTRKEGLTLVRASRPGGRRDALLTECLTLCFGSGPFCPLLRARQYVRRKSVGPEEEGPDPRLRLAGSTRASGL